MVQQSTSMRMASWLVLALVLLVPLGLGQSVAAQSGGFMITPDVRTIAGLPGYPVTTTFTLINNTSLARTINLSVTNLPSNGGDYSATFTSNGFTIAAGASQEITVRISIPTNAVPGTYTGIQIPATATSSAQGSVNVTGLINLQVVDTSLPVQVVLPLMFKAPASS